MARTLNAGAELKKEWMENSDACFEPLTFGELKIGQKFICLPRPGDNSGHGGFKKAHYVFMKIEAVPNRSSFPPDNAIRLKDGNGSHDPDGMYVLLIE